LKTGYCQYELKRYAQARATLIKVTDDYPDTAAARDAAERLSRMAAEGH
jgi:TolA-binding protein